MHHDCALLEMRNFRGKTLLSLVDGGISTRQSLLGLNHAEVAVEILFLYKVSARCCAIILS
jgi:hypothetical protein